MKGKFIKKQKDALGDTIDYEIVSEVYVKSTVICGSTNKQDIAYVLVRHTEYGYVYEVEVHTITRLYDTLDEELQ